MPIVLRLPLQLIFVQFQLGNWVLLLCLFPLRSLNFSFYNYSTEMRQCPSFFFSKSGFFFFDIVYGTVRKEMASIGVFSVKECPGREFSC
jgi:hypothetical protein